MNKGEALIKEGDTVYLLNDLQSAKALELKKKKKIRLTSTLPSIINDAQAEQSIWFDDGKIGGVIKQKDTWGLEILITQSGPTGSRLKAEKGINLPDTNLILPSLTEEDIQNLDFIVAFADIVGFSFVRRVEDVGFLQQELANRNRGDIGIVLKIENREAFLNLPALILKLMESPTVGIMTARGDLAVELGAERLSEVQEQIMWLCEAALIPNIWATQVLETLAKTGIPSRAEITDAAMSVRAECVMLNKGPYIDRALKTLNDILFRMEQHQFKKLVTLRKLNVAKEFWNQLEE
jgi:pyruvate kinase